MKGDVLEFVVPGRPVPKERPRLGRGRRVFTPARTKEYESWVFDRAQGATAFWGTPMVLNGSPRTWCMTAEYRVDLVCYFKPGPCADCDNLAKAVLDGMNGIVWDDDRQVTYLTIMRLTDRNERAEIRVECLTDAKPRKPKRVRKAAPEKAVKRVRARRKRRV